MPHKELTGAQETPLFCFLVIRDSLQTASLHYLVIRAKNIVIGESRYDHDIALLLRIQRTDHQTGGKEAQGLGMSTAGER